MSTLAKGIAPKSIQLNFDNICASGHSVPSSTNANLKGQA